MATTFRPVRIMGIDPGATTGVAIVDYAKDLRNILEHIEVPMWENLDVLMHGWTPDLIAIEAFRLYRHKAMAQVGSDFPSAQVIGVVKYMAAQREVIVVEQSASEIKHIKPDASLSSRHERDALRHCDLMVTKLQQAVRTKHFPRWYPELVRKVRG